MDSTRSSFSTGLNRHPGSKWILRGLLALACAIPLCLAATASIAKTKNRDASIVIETSTNRPLYTEHADSLRYPASLTKVMTLYLLFEELQTGRMTLDSKLKVSRRAANQAPSKLGVRAGQSLTVEQAILALITKSANDVAVVIAEAISGSEARFATRMTHQAREMGMRKTRFRNASGLPNRQQLTTARDMALLGQRVMEDFPEYYHYFSTDSFSWKGRTYRSHNKLLKQYQGTDGIKTGYTRASGFNVITSAQNGTHRVVAVVMGGRTANSRDAEMRVLLDRAFDRLDHPKRPLILDATVPQDTRKWTTKLNSQYDLTNPPSETAFALVSPVYAATTPAPDEEGDISADGNWMVQVGAFKSRVLARQRIELVAHWAAQLMHGKRAITEPVRNENELLFRARFSGFDQLSAFDFCARMHMAELGCTTVPPMGWQQVNAGKTVNHSPTRHPSPR